MRSAGVGARNINGIPQTVIGNAEAGVGGSEAIATKRIVHRITTAGRIDQQQT